MCNIILCIPVYHRSGVWSSSWSNVIQTIHECATSSLYTRDQQKKLNTQLIRNSDLPNTAKWDRFSLQLLLLLRKGILNQLHWVLWVHISVTVTSFAFYSFTTTIKSIKMAEVLLHSEMSFAVMSLKTTTICFSSRGTQRQWTRAGASGTQCSTQLLRWGKLRGIFSPAQGWEKHSSKQTL